MPWFKVDDKLHDHRKVRAAGKSAMGVWVLAGSWAADNLTDGFIPASILTRWGAKSDAARLVAAGFWHEDSVAGEDGWRFHEWAEYQPARAEIMENRAQAKSRMAELRANRKANNKKRSDDVRANTSRSSENVRSAPTRPDPTRPDQLQVIPPPAGAVGAATASAQTLIGEWIDHCGSDTRPPKAVIGQVSKQIKGLLDEGIPYPDVRAGLVAWHERRLNPATLPSVVHEVRVGPARPTARVKPSTTDQRVADVAALLPRMAEMDAADEKRLRGIG